MKKFVFKVCLIIVMLIVTLVPLQMKQYYGNNNLNINESLVKDEMITLTDIEFNVGSPLVTITSNINVKITCNQESFNLNDKVKFELQDIEGYYVKKVTVNGMNVDFVENSFEIVIVQENMIHVEYERIEDVKKLGFNNIIIALIVFCILLAIPLVVLIVLKCIRKYKI